MKKGPQPQGPSQTQASVLVSNYMIHAYGGLGKLGNRGSRASLSTIGGGSEQANADSPTAFYYYEVHKRKVHPQVLRREAPKTASLPLLTL